MKIVALLGSPRAEGNTRVVLESVLTPVREAGADVEIVALSELRDVTGCQECYGCQSNPDDGVCVIDDEMQGVIAKVLEADLIVFATPVFCWSMTWLLKMAVDRLFCTFKFAEDGFRTLLEGRAMAAVVTAGDPEAENSEIVAETFGRIAETCRCQYLGTFLAAGVATPDKVRADEELLAEARSFGQALIPEQLQ